MFLYINDKIQYQTAVQLFLFFSKNPLRLSIWSPTVHICHALFLGGARSCQNKPQVGKVWKSRNFANIMRQQVSLLNENNREGLKANKQRWMMQLLVLCILHLWHSFNWQPRPSDPTWSPLLLNFAAEYFTFRYLSHSTVQCKSLIL